MKNINAIVACDMNYGIGVNNRLPWPSNKEDMKWFKENTEGHVIVMGKKTWESLNYSKLKNRINVVITSQNLFNEHNVPDMTMTGNIEDILTRCKNIWPHLKIWVIGGKSVYEQALPYCEKLYLTKFKSVYECDTFISKESLLPFQKLNYCDNDEKRTFSIWENNLQ